MAKKNGGGIQNFSLRRLILERARINEHRQNSRTNDVESGSTKQGSCENVTNDGNYQKVIANEKEQNEFSDNICGSVQSEETDSCAICFLKQSETNRFFTLNLCKHKFCCLCLSKYLKNEINESRTDIACPQCSIQIHPDDIESLLQNTPEFIKKYEDFMIRRCLVTDPDSRWCPAPDCSFAVIASGCASCPQLQCERPDCRVSFCYHCKAEWHPDQTCDAARALRQSIFRTSSVTFSHDSTKRDDIKPCPRCQVLIIKVDDGSCNHMICSVCGSEFCWLCMKEVSDLHYLSPSGCTFWGKKPWSRKKKIVWQIGTLIGAPVGIALLAGIAIPSMIIGIPIWVARKLLERYKMKTKQKRNILVTIGVSASVLISPLLAGLAIAIGVPILLFLVYGIVPISLCRAGCGNPTNEEYKFGDQVPNEYNGQYGLDATSVEAISRLGGISLGDLSLSGASGSLTDNVNRNLSTNVTHHDSTTALAGSINHQNVKNYTSDIPYDESTDKIISNTSMGRLDEEV